MSWTDELAPMPLTPLNVVKDLVEAERHYRAEGVPSRRRAAFLLMRLGQRGAYWLGWTVSAMEARTRRRR